MHKGASALTTPLLDIRDLHVEADGSPVLHGVNLSIPIGETHVLFGPNGSGKSSLLATIMGLAPYRVPSGEIWFKGQRIDALQVDKRAQLGIALSFPRHLALVGATVEAIRAAIGPLAHLE